LRPQIEERELGDERATEHACDGAVPVELAVDVGRVVFDPQVAPPSDQHLHERAVVLLSRS
jgi:hypothetical protein